LVNHKRNERQNYSVFSALEPIWYQYQILTHNGLFGQLNL